MKETAKLAQTLRSSKSSEGWVEFDKEIVKHGKGRTCPNQEVEVKIS